MSAADISRNEKYSRSVALEEDYVHQIYEQIGHDLSHSKDPLEATVTKFLDELEPGSLVADIGCGDGRHLRDKNGIFSLGADSSCLQTSLARQRCQQVLLGDNLSLPFRGNAFDAVLSVGVIHHFTTKERRIKALKELSRILKIGGRVLIAVQQHNTQISQDVLMPWFDVPKDKRAKDKQWLDQDSGEYELEDDREEDQDEDDDEDSISLPSSDEDDTPWTNYAKFFPPQHYAKHGWNSDRHSRSLDCDYQTSSNNVPNSKQLVQTNACYAFVRKALKRFSSVNNSDEDPYFTSDLYQRADSAVPPSPASGQEQKFDLDNSSSFDQFEFVQKAISDNFIELLNIDEERDTSTLLRRRDFSSETLCRSDSKSDSPVKKKKNLIRSLSGMFKNVNSLWSSKETKSCSDLKSHATSMECSFKGKKGRDRRLVRSNTTATCKTEFDYYNPLENIDEYDMSVSEANKIINDFLESSMPSVETVRCLSNIKEADSFTSLTHSDIINGNIVPLVGDSVESHKYDEIKTTKFIGISDTFSFRKGIKSHRNSKYDFSSFGEASFKEINSSSDKNLMFSDNCQYNLFTSTEPSLKSKSTSDSKSRTDYKEEHWKSICDWEDSSIKARDTLSDSTCFEYQDDIVNYSISEKVIKEIPPFKGNITKETERKNFKMLSISEKHSPVIEEKMSSGKSINSDILQVEDESSHSENQAMSTSYNDKCMFMNEKRNLSNVSNASNDLQDACSIPSSKLLDNNQTQIWGIKQTFPTNTNYKCLLHNSPKRLRKLNPNYNYQMAESKTLGPFYDEDSGDINNIGDDSTLSSYYSMPELHALTEFYQEYRMYQNCVINNTSFELSKTRETIPPQTVDIYSVDHIPKSNIKTTNHLQNSNNDSILRIENYMYRESLNPEICIENLKTDLCNSIQTVFTNTISSEQERKADNKCNPINSIVKYSTKNFAIFSAIPLNKNLPLELNNINKCRSLICINSNSICSQNDNLKDFRKSYKLTRSHSTDTIDKRLKTTRCFEIYSPNSSLSQASLTFTEENSNNTNLNALKHSQRNLCNMELPYSFVDEMKNSSAQVCSMIRNKDSNFKRNKRAFSETNEDFTTFGSISPNSEDRHPSCNSSAKIFNPFENNMKKNINQKQNSVSHYDPLSHTEFPSELLNGKDVLTEKSAQKNHGVCAQEKGKHQQCFEPQIVPIKKTNNSDKTNHNHFSSLLSQLKLDDTIAASAPVSENKREAEIAFGNSETCSQVISYPPESPEKLQCLSHWSPEKRFKKGITQESSVPKKDSLIHFPHQNISEEEPKSPSLNQVELVCTDSEYENGAIKEKQLVFKEKSKNVSHSDSQNIHRNVDSFSLHISDSKCSGLKQNVEKLEHNKHFSDSHVIVDEKINHAYGRIHEDGAVVVGHRYHHLFKEEELDDLIENNISDLHVLNSFHEDSYWCVIAEKVRVWTI